MADDLPKLSNMWAVKLIIPLMNGKYLLFDAMGPFIYFRRYGTKFFFRLYEYEPATSLFTENIFCESVDTAHNSQISSTFQDADCLLKLVKVNKQVVAITLLNGKLNHTV